MIDICCRLKMQLSPAVHPLLTPGQLELLGRAGVRTLAALLRTRPERLMALLSLSYSGAAQLVRELLADQAGLPGVGLELYQNRLEARSHTCLTTGSHALDTLAGGPGLRPATLYELVGWSGAGKTQICLAAAARAVGRGGSAAWLDTKGDFCPGRLARMLAGQGRDPAALSRLRVCRAATASALLVALQQLQQEEELRLDLVVVDSITAPFMVQLTGGAVRAAGAGAGRTGQLLHSLAADRHLPVLVVSTPSPAGPAIPALGRLWAEVADRRLWLEQDSGPGRAARAVRGPAGQCRFNIGELGVTDLDQDKPSFTSKKLRTGKRNTT